MMTALPRIRDALRSRGRVLRQKDLAGAFDAHKGEWELPRDIHLNEFVRLLIEEGGVTRIHLPLPHRKETLYTVDDVPLLAVAVAAKAKAYLSHFTAMGLHGLTAQESKTIYINIEQRPQASNPASLTQESIDRAFRNQQRRTTNFVEYGGYRLMYLNGRFTGGLGVVDRRLDSGDTIRVTDLERTLIDAGIRPAYSGGVSEVLAAYRAAAGMVSVPKLAEMLSEMRLVYPYEQAIGFYLERAGFSASAIAPFRKNPFRFDFYLAHGIREVEHVPEWRLFIPEGL